jgi:hypothetical protein
MMALGWPSRKRSLLIFESLFLLLAKKKAVSARNLPVIFLIQSGFVLAQRCFIDKSVGYHNARFARQEGMLVISFFDRSH